MTDVRTRKKLIEVALPLEAINSAAANEKQPFTRRHPRSVHVWWARRPHSAARAVLFAQLVDDPSAVPEDFPTEGEQNQERQRLFEIIERLVPWGNTGDTRVFQDARDEILRSWRRACADNANHPRRQEIFNPDRLPAFLDPFAGGGALPLEAQRLGLEARARDLNPVSVVINKAIIELPSRFANRGPVNPVASAAGNLFSGNWSGSQALADDVRYYGRWVHTNALRRIGHLYPEVTVGPDVVLERPDLRSYAGRSLHVVAWIWARTVKSPNPAFADADIPLVSSFLLSSKPGHEAFAEPIVTGKTFRFHVRRGIPRDEPAARRGTRSGRAQDFVCLFSGAVVSRSYIRDEGRASRLGTRLMAVVAEGDRERVYLSPTPGAESAANASAYLSSVVDSRRGFLSVPTPTRAMITGGVCSTYGLTTFGDLFSSRQLVALTTLSDLLDEMTQKVHQDAINSGLSPDNAGLESGGVGAVAYAEAVRVYLALALSRWADLSNTICSWNSTNENIRALFARQAIPMSWDYAELSPFSSVGPWISAVETTCEAMASFAPAAPGSAIQADATASWNDKDVLISTDPPYYDNVSYAILSDFFYVWLRRSLGSVFPGLFATVSTPKADELIASPFRHGGRQGAESFFLNGMTNALREMAHSAHPAAPVTIYYAFKQSESKSESGTTSSAWEVFLEAIESAGFAVSGTWPVRTERAARSTSIGANALASSIVLVCRPRNPQIESSVSRRAFIAVLKAELPTAIANLQRANIAPVDLAQAAIGPGMAIFTRYATVLDAEGNPLKVREALALINQTLDEALAQQEGDFDADTRWALTWFQEQGFADGEYGIAETLATARNTSVSGLVEAGIVASARGKVRLLAPNELPVEWDPTTDRRLTNWDAVHHLIRVLEMDGESAAAGLVSKLGATAETARELAYRLYTICERKNRAKEALSYNGLVQSWPEMQRLARTERREPTGGTPLFGEA